MPHLITYFFYFIYRFNLSKPIKRYLKNNIVFFSYILYFFFRLWNWNNIITKISYLRTETNCVEKSSLYWSKKLFFWVKNLNILLTMQQPKVTRTSDFGQYQLWSIWFICSIEIQMLNYCHKIRTNFSIYQNIGHIYISHSHCNLWAVWFKTMNKSGKYNDFIGGRKKVCT